MGLPEILIEFKTKAETAVSRSENGIVAVILRDNTTEKSSYIFNYEKDIDKTEWTEKSLDYLNLIFKGEPKKVIVERIGTDENYDSALARLSNKKWNWLTIPQIENADIKAVSDWIISQRSAKKTFKAVLPCTSAKVIANHEGIVDFATEGIVANETEYTSHEYCARIAGLLAGLSMMQSSTYEPLSEVTAINESTAPDEDIDKGRLILINDGEKIKIARAVNSLHILSGEKTEDLKKIKIIEGMDLIRDDIRTAFESNYIGINNSYDNKMMFVSAINQYFKGLIRQGVLYDKGLNEAEIDIETQRDWLGQKYDVSEMSDTQIKQAKTGSYVFVKANIAFNDAIEDLKFSISME